MSGRGLTSVTCCPGLIRSSVHLEPPSPSGRVAGAVFRVPDRVDSGGRIRRCVMAHKLFVGGLAFSTSSERLREVFAAVGSVETSSVVTDRSTGQSRGFGFVEMSSAADAQQAVSRLNGQEGDGRQIRVEPANPSTGRGRSGGGFQRQGGGGRW